MTIITALPPAPSRDDPATFPDRANATMAALAQFVAQTDAVGGEINAAAAAAAASALSAVNAPGTNAQSTTSLAIGAGSKSLTIQTGKAFQVSSWVTIGAPASPNNWMVGYITAYNSGTGALTVNVLNSNGTGTFAAWTIAPSPPLVVLAALMAQIWAGTSNNVAITPFGLYGAAAFTAVADASAITLDFNAGINFALAPLVGNRTLNNPTNVKDGVGGYILVPQDTTGGRLLAIGSNWRFFGMNGAAPILSSSGGSMDLITYVPHAGLIYAGVARGG